MKLSDKPRWLVWAREIFSIAQAGLTYSRNEFDLERYHRLRELSAEIIAEHSNLAQEEVLQSLTLQSGYATPKVDVRGAVVHDGKILLIKEILDGKWAMPGGWADLGENPSEIAVREVLEESGYRVKVEKLIGIYDANRFGPLEFYHAYKLVFLCRLVGGEPRTSLETSEVGFFDPGDLPVLSSFRSNQEMIQEAFAHIADRARPTFFD